MKENLNADFKANIQEFKDQLRQIYFAYLDAIEGYKLIYEKAVPKASIEIVKVDQENNNLTLMLTRQGTEKKEFNTPGTGSNCKAAGKMAIAAINVLWKDKYWGSFANASGYESMSLFQRPIFKDINNIRNAMFHDWEKATVRVVEDNKVLSYWKIGDDIIVDEKLMKEIMIKMFQDLEGLEREIEKKNNN